MFSQTNDEDSCSCVSGPAGTCSNCKRWEDASKDDETNLTKDLYQFDYDISSYYWQVTPNYAISTPASETKVIKVKWIESVTDKAVLVLSKKDKWFWIPMTLIDEMDKTSKGNYKLTVPKSFKKKVIEVQNHHYFDRDEYDIS